MKSISYQKFADRFLAYTHRGKYIQSLEMSENAPLRFFLAKTRIVPHQSSTAFINRNINRIRSTTLV